MITNSTTLAEQIRLQKQSIVDRALFATEPSMETDAFADVDTPAYLENNLNAFNAANNSPATLDAYLGVQEENALLVSFRNVRQLEKRSRLTKWAHIYGFYKADVAEKGLLNRQIKFVGIKVEPQFLVDNLKIAPS
jgi:hypothetical protein